MRWLCLIVIMGCGSEVALDADVSTDTGADDTATELFDIDTSPDGTEDTAQAAPDGTEDTAQAAPDGTEDTAQAAPDGTEDTTVPSPDGTEDTADTHLADTAEVTPVCGDCDDGLDCTQDGCGVDGRCRHAVREGFCAINGRHP